MKFKVGDIVSHKSGEEGDQFRIIEILDNRTYKSYLLRTGHEYDVLEKYLTFIRKASKLEKALK